MHELGTVFYVIKEVEKVVEENNLSWQGFNRLLDSNIRRTGKK